MASLLDVKSLLEKAASDAMDIRITFYYSVESDVSVHAAHIFASSGGMCRIDYQKLPVAQALLEISRLRLLKVAALEMPPLMITSDPDWLPLSDFISLLDFAENDRTTAKIRQSKFFGGTRPLPLQSFSKDGLQTGHAEMRLDSDTDPLPLDLAKEAFLLLEPLFGVATAKKIDEFTNICPPDSKPHEFLMLCQKHAGMMLGNSKSNLIFKPLYDRLSESRMKRRKISANS